MKVDFGRNWNQNPEYPSVPIPIPVDFFAHPYLRVMLFVLIEFFLMLYYIKFIEQFNPKHFFFFFLQPDLHWYSKYYWMQ